MVRCLTGVWSGRYLWTFIILHKKGINVLLKIGFIRWTWRRKRGRMRRRRRKIIGCWFFWLRWSRKWLKIWYIKRFQLLQLLNVFQHTLYEGKVNSCRPDQEITFLSAKVSISCLRIHVISSYDKFFVQVFCEK